MKNLNHLTVFFSNKGLSMSEANHQANMTKEICEKVSRDLDNTASATESVIYEINRMIVLDSFQKLDNLEDLCKNEGKLYALSAWLREAINSKDVLLNYFKELKFQEFLNPEEAEEADKGFNIPKPIPPNFNFKIEKLSEEDIIGKMSIADRAEYLKCESIAAHLGKKLHKNGLIAKIRKEVQKFIPTRFVGLNDSGGIKDYPVVRTKLYSAEEMEKTFFNLQSEHRSAEQKLNWFKANIRNELTISNAALLAKANAKYKEEMDKYDIAVREWNTEIGKYQARLTFLTNLAEERRLNKIKEVSELKIVIPDDLQSVLEFVKNYS